MKKTIIAPFLLTIASILAICSQSITPTPSNPSGSMLHEFLKVLPGQFKLEQSAKPELTKFDISFEEIVQQSDALLKRHANGSEEWLKTVEQHKEIVKENLTKEIVNQGGAKLSMTPELENAIQMLGESRALMEMEIRERLTAPKDPVAKHWEELETKYAERRAERQAMREALNRNIEQRRKENIEMFGKEFVEEMDRHSQAYAKDFFEKHHITVNVE